MIWRQHIQEHEEDSCFGNKSNFAPVRVGNVAPVLGERYTAITDNRLSNRQNRAVHSRMLKHKIVPCTVGFFMHNGAFSLIGNQGAVCPLVLQPLPLALALPDGMRREAFGTIGHIGL